MKRIGFDTLHKWCSKKGYSLDNWIPTLSSKAWNNIELKIPSAPLSITEMLDDLVELRQASIEMVVWIRDWTIWNERSQDIGLRHLELVSASAERDKDWEQGQIYLLTEAEWKEAIALISIPVLYSWDAHLLFEKGDSLVDISHEDRISVSLLHEGIPSRLTAWIT